MLTTLAAQIAIAIENARLYQAVHRQERQLERDIAMAREVQLRLLPPEAPSHPHAEMAVRFLPARTIGGDLYDFLDYGPNRTAIVLGDVSGKAAPAALFAALVSGIMRAAAAQQPDPAADAGAAQRRPAGAQARIAVRHDALRALERREPDPAGREFRRSAAGLLPRRPIRCRSKPKAFRWACFPTSTYEELSVATQPGDAIVFVSDGILDAEERERGDVRTGPPGRAALRPSAIYPPTEIAEAILADVARFQGSKDRFDDETIIVLRVR